MMIYVVVGTTPTRLNSQKEYIIMSKNIELSLRNVEQALRARVREQQKTIDDLKERAKWSMCANDEYIPLPPHRSNVKKGRMCALFHFQAFGKPL